MWQLATSSAVDKLTAWMLSLAGDFAANVGRTLDTFFADPWARSKHFPVTHLANYPEKYLEPREEPVRGPVGSVRRTLSAVREERKQALLAGDIARVQALNTEVDELERAEEARARGGFRARA